MGVVLIWHEIRGTPIRRTDRVYAQQTLDGVPFGCSRKLCKLFIPSNRSRHQMPKRAQCQHVWSRSVPLVSAVFSTIGQAHWSNSLLAKSRKTNNRIIEMAHGEEVVMALYAEINHVDGLGDLQKCDFPSRPV